MHLFYDCLIVKRLWNRLKSILSNNPIFPISTPDLKPLTTYFQNVHIQYKNNRLLECKLSADIY